jgi:hypothetical protein
MTEQPQPSTSEDPLRRRHPVDVASTNEIKAAWDYFTNLPKDHYNRIHIIQEFSTPWEGGSLFEYYTIRYRFRCKRKKIRLLGFTATMTKERAITKILKDTDLDIAEAPIPPFLSEQAQEEIRERRRRQGPKEQKGRGEGNDYDPEDEDDLIMEEIESWKTRKVIELD